MSKTDRIDNICEIIKNFVEADKVEGINTGANETFKIYKSGRILVIDVLSTPNEGAWISVCKYEEPFMDIEKFTY